MRGQNEQLSRSVADIQRTQKDLKQGVEDRLQKIEPSKVSVDGKEFVADPAEKQEFDAALAALRKSDFAGAQTAFMNFMSRYPQSGYRASALFWLGNAQYASRNYKEAVTTFRSMVTAEPQHTRAPEAFLSMANSQVELKDAKSARKSLEDLVKAYPQSEAAAVAKERLAKLKYPRRPCYLEFSFAFKMGGWKFLQLAHLPSRFSGLDLFFRLFLVPSHSAATFAPWVQLAISSPWATGRACACGAWLQASP